VTTQGFAPEEAGSADRGEPRLRGAPREVGFPDALDAAARGSRAAVWLDRQDRIRESTSGAASMLGYEPPALVGRTLIDLAAEGWRAAAEVASARVRYGSTESFDLLLRGRSGRHTLVVMNARLRTFPDGEPGAMISWTERQLRRRGLSHPDGSEITLRRLADSLLRAQEEERARVAGELRDEVSQLVVLAKYMIEDVQSQLARGSVAEAGRVLDGVAPCLRRILGDLDRISTGLRPRLIDDLGLGPTLQWICRDFGSACPGLAVRCHIEFDESILPPEGKLAIFRVAQEALANVAQHARASQASLSLLRQYGELRLCVEDDGIGFDPAQVSLRGFGLGFQAMRRRIEETGGSLSLESAPGRGTRLVATWRPVPGAARLAA